MHHVPPAIAVESHDHLDLFSLIYGNRVLRSLFPGHWRGSVSLQNLETYQTNVDWMGHADPAGKFPILQMPNFRLSVRNFCHTCIRVKALFVDGPSHGGRVRERRPSNTNSRVRRACWGSRGSISPSFSGTLLSSRSSRTTSKRTMSPSRPSPFRLRRMT